MLNRRQAIVWTNDGPYWWRIYASVGHNELNAMRYRQIVSENVRPFSGHISRCFSLQFVACLKFQGISLLMVHLTMTEEATCHYLNHWWHIAEASMCHRAVPRLHVQQCCFKVWWIINHTNQLTTPYLPVLFMAIVLRLLVSQIMAYKIPSFSMSRQNKRQ